MFKSLRPQSCAAILLPRPLQSSAPEPGKYTFTIMPKVTIGSQRQSLSIALVITRHINDNVLPQSSINTSNSLQLHAERNDVTPGIRSCTRLDQNDTTALRLYPGGINISRHPTCAAPVSPSTLSLLGGGGATE